ncbi:hypothetical protein BAL199_05969 [alpha proteobacterium BAL199]|jgi:hypothetical protein|nr:hypothetical protein BAL199_05969 [alpha proteobacterium BAL199]
MTPDAINVTFGPLVPWPVVVALGLIALAAAGYVLARRARGGWWRAGALALLVLALANPSIVAERREPRPDVVVVAVDRTASQEIGERSARTDAAVEALDEKLARLSDITVKRVSVMADGLSGAEDGTRLMAAVREALVDVPAHRLAGVIAVTDGQVHDAAAALAAGQLPGPFHVLLSGDRNERDRRLRVVRAPSFGMVDKTVTVTIEVVDPNEPAGASTTVLLGIDGGEATPLAVPANQEHSIEIPIEHGGQTILEFAAEPGRQELVLDNNRAVIAVNGVRDRLRVLLVSGEPHAGERTWRDILKSDPSVDLVHFTILRPPEKQDGTPIRELSLIAFPIRELFELKLADFNLIIFDRYRRRGVLPRMYMQNIAEYVRKGGALLEASGPTFASRLSLARTPIGDVLPAQPTGGVIEQGFRPRVTGIGERHPVTAGLAGAGHNGSEPTWGRWFRQIEARDVRGNVVMSGDVDRPLLILDRVGEGRVAHLLSDQMWLWSRGYEGGGPQAELLRRTAHWLMREPDLEEDVLHVFSRGDALEIERRTLDGTLVPVRVTSPDGTTQTVELEEVGPGNGKASIQVRRPGLYRLTDGVRTAMVAVGALNPIELSDVAATDRRLAPIVEATGGGLQWLVDDGVPALRRVSKDRAASGRGWFGLRTNGDYVVTGVLTVPALPAALALLLLIGSLMVAWRREGD